MVTPSGESIEELTRAAHELIGKVDQINAASGERVDTLARASKMNRRIIEALSAITFVVVVLCGLMAFALKSTIDNTNRLDAGATTSRQKALCPLYQVFLDSNTKEARAAAPDKARYDRAYKVIQDGYDALGCSEFKGSAPKLGR